MVLRFCSELQISQDFSYFDGKITYQPTRCAKFTQPIVILLSATVYSLERSLIYIFSKEENLCPT